MSGGALRRLSLRIQIFLGFKSLSQLSIMMIAYS